jgi:hypothetical protein
MWKGVDSVNMRIVQPYFYQAVQHSYFLNLNEQQDLTLSRSSAQDEWGQEEILQQNCNRFVAAPDGNDCLHIVAADSHNKLYHIIVTKEQVQTKPFITQENSGPFLLSFAVNGMGYFFYIEDSKSGKLKAAKYSPAFGWEDELSPEQSYSVPVSLAIDNSSGIHLLLYDLKNDSLNYYFRNQGMKRWADPLCLDSELQLSLLPALWVTAGHNIHIAWYQPCKDTVCYRMKKVGGWPVGGWQHEQHLPLSTAPSLISFHEESESVKVWCIGTESKVDVFYQQNDIWEQVSEETDDCLPVRHGTTGGELYNLARALPPTNLFFTKIPSQATIEPAVEQKNEQEQKPRDQIMQLIEEKRCLNALLQKKEESLAQYRLMLERSHEKSTRQQSEWESKSDAKLRNLEEEYRQSENENKSLNKQLKQVQKKLSAMEAATKDHRMETDTLHSALTKSKQQEENLQATIRKMEEAYRQCEAEINNIRMETDTLRLELTKSKQQEENLLATIRKMEEAYRQYKLEKKSFNDELKQVQRKLSAKETAIRNHRMETDTLRSELIKSKQKEENLQTTIRKMKKEMESRKGILDKISSAFHKKG